MGHLQAWEFLHVHIDTRRLNYTLTYIYSLVSVGPDLAFHELPFHRSVLISLSHGQHVENLNRLLSFILDKYLIGLFAMMHKRDSPWNPT